MSATRATRARPGTVTRALAKDKLGVPAVLFFVLAGVAPLTVAARSSRPPIRPPA